MNLCGSESLTLSIMEHDCASCALEQWVVKDGVKVDEVIDSRVSHGWAKEQKLCHICMN